MKVKPILPLAIAVALVGLAGCGPADDADTAPEPEADTRARALSGPTCADAVNDDYSCCVASRDKNAYFLSAFYPYTMSWIADHPTYCIGPQRDGSARCNQGYMRVYRIYDGGHPGQWWNVFHRETLNNAEQGSVEGTFNFAAWPQPGADPTPIYRCFITSAYGVPLYDFPTHNATCEGLGQPYSIHGYSYAPGVPGVRPAYRCRVAYDHFLSWASNCEGQVFEGVIGYGWGT